MINILRIAGFWMLISCVAGYGQTADFSAETRAQMVQQGVQTNNWNGLVAGLLPSLTSNIDFTGAQTDWSATLHLAKVMQWLGKNEMDCALSDPQMYGRPDRQPKNQLVAQRLKPETLTALLSNGSLVNSLAITANDRDYLPGVFSVLADLQEHAPDQMEAYANLAVALAVVYDVNVPEHWPHYQVNRTQLTVKWENWVELFDYFVQENENQHLLMDLKSQPADILKYVVDAPIDLSEFAWVKKNVKTSRAEFAETYFLVQYDTPRLDHKQYDWVNGVYTLANIQKTGGICIDQAYFAAMAGKARGLPTIAFSGVGSDGFHAWFGYLKGNTSWNMNGGRYADQQFTTGVAYDPQDWQEITDHELAFITNRISATEDYQHSQDVIALAELQDVRTPKTDDITDTKLKLYKSAQNTCPDNLGAWMPQIDILKQTKSEDLKPFLQCMLTQFNNQPDIKAKLQTELLAASQQEGDTQAVVDLKKNLASAADGRVDISIKNKAAQLLDQLASANDPDGLKQVITDYKSTIRKFADSAAGELYTDLVEPFISRMIKLNQQDEARKCLVFTESTIYIRSGSQIDEYYQDLDKTVGIKRAASQ